jgi:hypothetical protein
MRFGRRAVVVIIFQHSLGETAGRKRKISFRIATSTP